MLQAMPHITEYTWRELSYDSDALKAISGALAVLPPAMGSPVYHITGVPFTKSTYNYHGSITIALHWIHLSESRRRVQYPSWSLLGWAEWVVWADQMPTVPEDLSVALCRTSESVDLHLLLDSTNRLYDAERADPAQLLDIVAHTVELSLRSTRETLPTATGNLSEIVVRLTLPMDAATEVVVRAKMDVLDGSHDHSANPCLGLILRNRDSLRTARHDDSAILVILLQPHHDHYERIDLLELPVDENAIHYNNKATFRPKSAPELLSAEDRAFVKESFLWLKHAKKQRILLG
jgi:hypothetical protein